MNKKLAYYLSLGLCTLALTSALCANEANEPKKDHIPVGERALALESRMEEQKQCYEQTKSAAQSERKVSKSAKSLAKGIYSTSHNGAFQTLYSVSAFGDIELIDGSIWKVAPSDVYTVLTWYASDLLIITPNDSWFSAYQFKITNQATGQAVQTNLYLGPLYNGIYTHWIIAIDYMWDRVYLEDGSVWSMSPFDSSIVSQWKVNDTVIIGVNDGFFSTTRPNILINVNMLNYATGNASF